MRTVASLATLTSIALLSAVAAAAIVDPKPCQACTEPENAGLCHDDRCQRQVLPVLRESSLKKDAHSGPYWKKPPVPIQEKASATEHAERMASQSSGRLKRIGRLAGAMDGHGGRRQSNRRTSHR